MLKTMVRASVSQIVWETDNKEETYFFSILGYSVHKVQ